MSKVNHIGDANGMMSDSKGGEFETFKNQTMSKQTAIEWIIEALGEYFPHGIGGIEYMVKQAKEIEKQQHGKTWDCAIDNLDARGGNVVRAWADFDDYYNETYGR